MVKGSGVDGGEPAGLAKTVVAMVGENQVIDDFDAWRRQRIVDVDGMIQKLRDIGVQVG